MPSKVLERIKVYAGDATLSLGGESNDTITTKAFLKMDKFGKYTAIGCLQGVASLGVATLTLWKATAAAGTNSATFTTTITDTATSTNVTDLLILAAEVDAQTLQDEISSTGSSFYWIGAKLVLTTGPDSNENGALVHFVSQPTYEPQSN